MSRKIREIAEVLDQVDSLQMQFQETHALLNYSELLLSKSSKQRCENARTLKKAMELCISDSKLIVSKIRTSSVKSQSNTLLLL